MVFGHGLGTNALVWYQQVPWFARRHRVVLYDQRGFGRSLSDPANLGIRFGADDLRAVCEAAGVGRAAFVGHSIGAVSALRLALEYPERVSCLVLCSSAGGVITETLLQAIGRAASGYAREGATSGQILAPGFTARESAKAFLLQQILGLSPPFDPAVMAEVLELRVRDTELVGFAIPTLIVCGRHDRLTPSDALQGAAERIPGAKVVEFAASGHLPFFEEPARFNRVVGEFILRHSPA